MKNRDLDTGDVLPASLLDALQEYVSTLASNVRLAVTSTTDVTMSGAAGSQQVALGIGGLWRYRTTAVATAISGAAGVRDLYVTATANDFRTTPTPDSDFTDYNFNLVATIPPATPSGGGIVASRKIGEVDWDGSKITGLRQTVGLGDATANITPTASNLNVSPVSAVGASGQAAPLYTGRIGAAAPVFTVAATGAVTSSSTLQGTTVNATSGFQVNGTALAASHLSNGTNGTGAVSLTASPTFTGIPAAPTAAVDTNTTQVATTAFVVGQGYAKLASPTFTGDPKAPTPTAGDNDTSIATTAFVTGALAANGGVAFKGSAQTFTAAQTFGAAVEVNMVDPRIDLYDSDGTADQRRLRIAQSASETRFVRVADGGATTNMFLLNHNNLRAQFAGTLQALGTLDHDGTLVGFYGVDPVARAAARTLTNWTSGSNTLRTVDRSTFTMDQLFDFVMSMADDLRLLGLYA
jgi:hypothetical protein